VKKPDTFFEMYIEVVRKGLSLLVHTVYFTWSRWWWWWWQRGAQSEELRNYYNDYNNNYYN